MEGGRDCTYFTYRTGSDVKHKREVAEEELRGCSFNQVKVGAETKSLVQA